MAFYAFAPDPPPPRTTFQSPSVQQEPCEDCVVTEFELLVANVLMSFPEAYRAVVAELRRVREAGGLVRKPPG